MSMTGISDDTRQKIYTHLAKLSATIILYHTDQFSGISLTGIIWKEILIILSVAYTTIFCPNYTLLAVWRDLFLFHRIFTIMDSKGTYRKLVVIIFISKAKLRQTIYGHKSKSSWY